ncbi:hypothetical protein LI328DRAFT_130923 [Trichoderma asperelloides]|nr:hypothetical protein LI328DRAFT_130923 [Trichoderma asperelloides]
MASSPFRSLVRRQLQLAFRPRHQLRAQSSSSSPQPSSQIQDRISKQIPSSSLATATATTTQNAVISRPLWQRLGPVTRAAQAYGRSQKKRPYVTQTITSMFIFFFADLGAQSMNDDDYDPSRTVRNIIIGAGTAIPAYSWFMFLAKHFNYTSRALSLGVKIFINQLIFAPGINIYFFSMQALLAGDGISGAVQRVQDTLLTSWINSCKIWPFVMAFSLSFVPLEYRSLFTGAINVFWQGYLSLLNRWAEAREAEAAEPLVAAPIALVEAA